MSATGTRKPNGSGYIRTVYLASGEARYRVGFQGAYIGTRESMSEAQRLLEKQKERPNV